jgi:hypothetical protein
MLSLLSPDTFLRHLKVRQIMDYLNTFVHQIGFQISLELILIVFAFSLLTVAILQYYSSTIQAAYTQEFSYETQTSLQKK